MTSTRRLAAPAAALTLALILAGCSAGPDDGVPTADRPSTTQDEPGSEARTAAAHNDADTEFAQMMIIHHEGAVEMAELAVDAAATEEVRALGDRIARAQDPEIDRMAGWLEAWGEPQSDEADMGGMGHEGMDMDGMDQASAMSELTGLSGPDFDRRFLEFMIAHHRGAVVMAETELDGGTSPDATRLAQTVIEEQTAEIAEMTELLGGL